MPRRSESSSVSDRARRQSQESSRLLQDKSFSAFEHRADFCSKSEAGFFSIGGFNVNFHNGRQQADLTAAPPVCPDWMHEVVTYCQRVVNRLSMRSAADPVDLSELDAFRRPRTRVEELLLHGLLMEIILAQRGGARSDLTARAIAIIKEGAVSKRRRHQPNAVARAARFIDARYAEPLNVPLLASLLGSREATLRASFARKFAVSMRGYHKRARIRAAAELFAAGESNVLSVARQVGYHSEKNFYAAVRDVTGGTPCELRATARRESR